MQEPSELSQIGGVAERLGVSTRTIKYYEELGLVSPENRSPGGFRLYNASDIERLRRILRLKGMGFSLAAIREFIAVRDAAQEATRERVLAETTEHLRSREREVAQRIAKTREDLKSAEALREELRRDISLCESRMRELKRA
ncbi:MAG: Transcriptional regulator, MerR family [uncultured Rubrobacteraceae bacterium]|uniref:Transcriptional regulator, MerR family n=1 Tax=uncultured Rubrobacteraceae bacterium TaxID=349277 RepID=A0A6J4NTQ4_9ACTN|nr:MAG: Transcriptional regulator, MerR family [uncultured Rubrobacteraceae bacterium]